MPRYNCPVTGYPGTYMLLDTNTRMGVGYFSDGTVRWGPTHTTERDENYNVLAGIWVLAISPDQQLPEGF